LRQEIKKLPFLIGFLLLLVSCQLADKKFRLRPQPNKIYNYSLVQTSEYYNKSPGADSSQHFAGERFDTLKINFSLENIHSNDSAVRYKLTFKNFFKKKPDFKIIFRSMDNSSNFISKDPYGILDSIDFLVAGKSLQVAINRKGAVIEVTGVDELFKNIYGGRNDNERNTRSFMLDYISSPAIKDLMNRMFSPIPGFKVDEGDRWIRNITLVTKAPVKLSNEFAMEQHNNDTAYISFQSLISAQQSEGSKPYMKGKGKGIAMVNYATGMPYLFETRSETVTTTSAYDFINKEHFLIKECR
jgi:hypothetical protein